MPTNPHEYTNVDAFSVENERYLGRKLVIFATSFSFLATCLVVSTGINDYILEQQKLRARKTDTLLSHTNPWEHIKDNIFKESIQEKNKLLNQKLKHEASSYNHEKVWTNNGEVMGNVNPYFSPSGAQSNKGSPNKGISKTTSNVATHLKTWPSKIEDGGDLVVFWDDMDTFRKEDYLTLSCGPVNDENDFLMQKNVTDSDSTPNSVRFSGLYMLRCNYTVRYFNYQPHSRAYALKSKIDIPMRESIHAPKHGHISLTSKEDEMAVMFNSASNKTPCVRYGLSSNDLKNEARGTSTTYKASDMCQAPANQSAQRLFRDPGYMHTVILQKLKPGHKYFYQFGNGQDEWSDVYSFTARPSDDVQNAQFIAYADMGVDDGRAAQSTASRVYEEVTLNGYDSFLLHFGDVSYARGEGSVWDKFFHMIESYATRLPYMISIGNHEYDYTEGGEHDPSNASGAQANGFHPSWGNYGKDSNGECSVPMKHRWKTPDNGNSLYWYSFNYGGVHVVQMSSEHNWTRGSEQYEWIKKDLESVDRSVTPWVVLTSHRMMYTTQLNMENDIRVAKHFREEMDDLLYQNHVNLVLVGHQHAYERSCPVYKGQCGKGPVHIVVGSAGFQLDTADFSNKYGNWSVRHVNEYGFLRVNSTKEAMQIEFIMNKNGLVYDQVTLEPW